MALKVGELYGLLKLDKSNFDKGLKSSGLSFNKFKGLIIAGAASAALAIVGIGGAAAKLAVDFEKSMANVQTLIGKGSEADARIKELGASVKDMSVETGKSLEDLSGGLYTLIGTLGDTADSTAWLELAAKSGAAGLATTEEAISLLTAVTKSYGDTSVEAGQKVADLAFQAANLGVTTFPEMAAAMGRVIPMAAALKVSQEELFAVMATLTGVTGSTDEVVTQLRGGMTAFLKPSKEMQKALKELGYTGVNAGQDLVKKEGLVGAIQAVEGSATATEKGIAKLFRNTNTLNAVMALTGGSAASFEKNLKAMGDAAGSTAQAFEIQQKTVAASMDRVGAAFNVVLVNLGEKFLPVLADLLDWVSAHMPEIAAIIDGVFAFIGESIDFFVKNVLPVLIAGFEFVSETIVPLIQDAFDTISNDAVPALSEAFAWITETVIPALGDVFTWIVENVLPPVMSMINTVTQVILPALGEAFGGVVSFVQENWPLISTIVGGVASFIKEAVTIIANVFNWLWPIIVAVARELFPKISAAVKLVLEVVTAVFSALGTVWTQAKDAVDKLVKGVTRAFELLKIGVSTVWNAIVGVVKGAINSVIGAVNGMIRALNGIQIHIPSISVGPVQTPRFDWNGLGLGQIPYLASGTNFFEGGWAMLGERGPEAAFLPRGTQVANAMQTREMMEGGRNNGPEEVHYHLDVQGLVRARDPFEIVTQMRRLQTLGKLPGLGEEGAPS